MGVESSILSFRKRVGSECLEKLLSHEILLLRSLFERREIISVVAVMDDHVVTGTDESVVFKATEPSHTSTIVASRVRESDSCGREAAAAGPDADLPVDPVAVKLHHPLTLGPGGTRDLVLAYE
jgi:hypothetical protein